MRITNQMLNESARKAGLPINSKSLLNYINNDSSKNTLLSALSKDKSSVADPGRKSNYEKLEKASDQLLQKAEIFTIEGEDSIFAKARKSESNQEIYDSVEALVENYNHTIKTLKTVSTPLNGYYYQMMQEAADENREALGSIGITISKDGTAVLDKEKLKAADTDTLEKVLGTSGTFSTKMAFLAARISDNAQTNAKSLTSQYNSKGNIYSALSNKYDIWG